MPLLSLDRLGLLLLGQMLLLHVSRASLKHEPGWAEKARPSSDQVT